jgi:hypothetical protein
LEYADAAVLYRAVTKSFIVVGSVEAVPLITPVGSSSVKVEMAQCASCIDESPCRFAYEGKPEGLRCSN